MDINTNNKMTSLETLRAGVLETLYPTRCALCDKPGTLLCHTCEQSLGYIDYWQACPTCGGAWGWRQCTDCNRVTLKPFGLDKLPFESCHNAVRYDDLTKRIVSAYKDQGEQRIAIVMARITAKLISPELANRLSIVTFVPATAKAIRRRNFDHAELFARHIAKTLGLSCRPLLQRPRTLDQRKLHAGDRQRNMKGAFAPLQPMIASKQRILLIDDVMTTGSTLFNASIALKAAGAAEVHALTFAHAL